MDSSKVETIHSIKHEKITLARAVKTLAGRNQHKRMLLEGEQILDWAIANQVNVEFVLFVKDSANALVEKYVSQGIPV